METINHECYVSFEVAKLLKQAGFDYKVRLYYEHNGKLRGKNSGSFINFNSPTIWENNGNTDKQLYSAPTLDVAQRWLREVHHLHITIFSSSQESWMFRITKPHQNLENGVYGEDFYTYEEAQEAGIKKALEMVLEKGE